MGVDGGDSFLGLGECTYLELGERESTSCSHATVVFDRGAADDGAELVDGTGSYGAGFLETGISTAGFAAGLVVEISDPSRYTGLILGSWCTWSK